MENDETRRRAMGVDMGGQLDSLRPRNGKIKRQKISNLVGQKPSLCPAGEVLLITAI